MGANQVQRGNRQSHPVRLGRAEKRKQTGAKGRRQATGVGSGLLSTIVYVRDDGFT